MSQSAYELRENVSRKKGGNFRPPKSNKATWNLRLLFVLLKGLIVECFALDCATNFLKYFLLYLFYLSLFILISWKGPHFTFHTCSKCLTSAIFTSYDFLILWIFKRLIIASKVKYILALWILMIFYLTFFSFAFTLPFSFWVPFILFSSLKFMRCIFHVSSGLWIYIHIDICIWVEEHPNWWASLQSVQDPEVSGNIKHFP